MTYEWRREHLLISTDKFKLDREYIHRFLSSSYWAKDIPVETVKNSIEGSLCFGVYTTKQQIGFGRVISDLSTFAYLADVFIDEKHRGTGIGKWLVESILSHPKLQGLRRWMLATRDAHDLYSKFGFRLPEDPGRYMTRSPQFP